MASFRHERFMTQENGTKTKIAPIAFAEAGSAVVSLGSLWVMEKMDGIIEPIQHALARTISGKQTPEKPQEDPQYQQAYNRASLIVKGTGMNLFGFATHIPMQLALEGKSDAKSFGIAASGKGVGIAFSIGSILLLNKFAPEAMQGVKDGVVNIISPMLPKDKKDRKAAEEVTNLLILEVSSSVIAGLVNYAVARKLR